MQPVFASTNRMALTSKGRNGATPPFLFAIFARFPTVYIYTGLEGQEGDAHRLVIAVIRHAESHHTILLTTPLTAITRECMLSLERY